MKKINLLLLVLTLLTNNMSRGQYSSYIYNEYSEFHINTNARNRIYEVDSYALRLGIKQYNVFSTHYGKKGKVSKDLSSVYFNKNGTKAKDINYNDTHKTKIIYIHENRYNEKNLFTEYINTYGDDSYRTINYYNDSNKISEQYYYNDDNILSTKSTYIYNGDGKITENIGTNKKQEVLYKYLYTYKNNELKQAKLLDKKGKIKRVWNYNCDGAGIVLKKAEDTSKICTTKTYLPDGSIMATTQGYDWQKKPYKMIIITNTQNKLIEYKYLKGINDQLINQDLYNYNKDGKLLELKKLYFIKSKIHSTTTKTFDTQGRITSDSRSYKKSKITNSYSYAYNAQGLITEKKLIKNGVLKVVSNFSYLYY